MLPQGRCSYAPRRPVNALGRTLEVGPAAPVSFSGAVTPHGPVPPVPTPLRQGRRGDQAGRTPRPRRTGIFRTAPAAPTSAVASSRRGAERRRLPADHARRTEAGGGKGAPVGPVVRPPRRDPARRRRA